MEKYVFLNLWTMRVIGICYPEKSSSSMIKMYIILRGLAIASILFILLPAVVSAVDHLQKCNISSSVEILALLLSAIVVLCKTVNIIIRRNEIRILLNRMSDFWQEAEKIDEIMESMIGFAELGKKVTKFYLALGFFSIISFCVQPFLNSYISRATMMGNSSDNINPIAINRMPFDGWENFVANSHDRPKFLFVIVYISHVFVGIIATIASIGHDCFFVVLIFHVCANLRALSTKLKEITFFRNIDQIDENIGKNVIRCAKTFQNLIEYTKELENMLSLYLLAQSLSSTIIICLTSFLVSRDLDTNKELFKYISFWAAALFQIFIFCWAANYLQTEANKVGRSAYEAYGKLIDLQDFKNHSRRHSHLHTKIPRYLQMILLRSQTPLKITAGNFYVMSLENYKKILSTSYSYFTILRAVADNH